MHSFQSTLCNLKQNQILKVKSKNMVQISWLWPLMLIVQNYFFLYWHDILLQYTDNVISHYASFCEKNVIFQFLKVIQIVSSNFIKIITFFLLNAIVFHSNQTIHDCTHVCVFVRLPLHVCVCMSRPASHMSVQARDFGFLWTTQ